MKRLLLAFLCVISLSGCGTFHTAKPDLHNVELAQVWTTMSSAYYLGCDGTLYSPGADSDATSYVLYQNQKKGIVANDVRFFGEMAGGGFYINTQNELLLWNKSDIPLYGYEKKDGHAVVCTDVIFAECSGRCMLFLKENGELYLAGEFGDEEYTIKEPKLLGNGVTAADTDGTFVIWTNADGELLSYGTAKHPIWFDQQILKQVCAENVRELHLERHYVAILTDKSLWCCGEDGKLQRLGEEIKTVSCARRTLAALESDGSVRVWGRCIGNGATQTDTAEYVILNGEIVAENATSVMVSDSTLNYVGNNGISYVFYADGWPEFYGNATKDRCVGIGREPNSWIK
ncbi:MAG: hypothetical protein J6J83_02045 [Oscillospiraceae bacterium]|nr:hypothetical protein [Oscillospiraceae bacterium]